MITTYTNTVANTEHRLEAKNDLREINDNLSEIKQAIARMEARSEK